MYNIIYFFRYIFLIYIFIFLLQGFLIALTEKSIMNLNIKKLILGQRIIILLFHLSSILILLLNSNDLEIKNYINIVLIKSIIFIFLGNLILINFFKNSCPIIWNGIFFLMSLGFIMLLRLNPYLAEKQLNWFIIGFIISLFIPLVLNIFKNLSKFKFLYLIVGLSLLILTLKYGVESGGSKNWITIKNITFQPSELVKILFIFYLSSDLTKNNLSFKKLFLPTVISFMFIFCLVLQVDLGSSLIFLMTYLTMVYIATSNSSILILGIVFSSICTNIAYKYFNHLRVRISIWKNPWEDISGKGYQITQSLFAIVSYGLLGSGLGLGKPKTIPVVEKDFIFSAICEEFGVLFGIGVILIFIMIFFRCVKISLNSSNKFLSLVCSGLTSLMCFQTFLILGGVTNLIPLTGVTLPFISYGGSSLIISFTQIGIIQWIKSKNKVIL